MEFDVDVLIIGSGPAGAHAADEALQKNLKVGLVSVGIRPKKEFESIPRDTFTHIRQSDPRQKDYFLGRNFRDAFLRQSKAGTHLTPPRQYMLEEAETLFPANQESFYALSATGRGGLGISWGSNCFTFNTNELKEAGIPDAEMNFYYEKVSELIGVSGDKNSETQKEFFDVKKIQSPLKLDTNCSGILSSSKKLSSSSDVKIGQSFVAILSEDKKNRKKNKLDDMDFWTNNGDSVWRPDSMLNELQKNENFIEYEGYRIDSFKEYSDHVIVNGIEISSKQVRVWKAKKLFICAGAINSARLVIQSLGLQGHSFPLLCNRNIWIASINLKMLGQKVEDARYSLSQLTAGFYDEDKKNVPAVAHFYSYRSLLLFRLIPKIPLPTRVALLFLRLIINSFTLINVHFYDTFALSEYSLSVDNSGLLYFNKHLSKDEANSLKKVEKRIKKFLFKLGCIPLSTDRPQDGASIHYAGTLGSDSIPASARVNEKGQLGQCKHVYVADSSHWKYLPAKGLTFSIMANARRIVNSALGETL